MALSFGQVEEVLATANNIASERREAFQSRLKQWQKMGFPEGVNVGRGLRAKYGAKQLFQLAFCIRLMALGLTPERSQEVIVKGWPKFRQAMIASTERMIGGERPLVYLMISLDALTPLQEPSADHMHIHATPTTAEIIADGLVGDPEDYEPEDREGFINFQLIFRNAMVNTLVLEVDSILLRIWYAMEFKGISVEALSADFEKWLIKVAEEERNDSTKPLPVHKWLPDQIADFAIQRDPFELARRVIPSHRPPKETAHGNDPQT